MTGSREDNLARTLANCRNGDRDAWYELIEVVAPVIFSVCKRARLSRDESFDIYGQICLELVRSIAEVESPASIKAYVATITKRKIYRIYRRMQIFERITDDVQEFLHGRGEEDPDVSYGHIERRRMLKDAISELPERDGRLIEMLFLDPGEPSYKDISDQLDMPVSSIGPTRMRALRELQRILRRRGYRR